MTKLKIVRAYQANILFKNFYCDFELKFSRDIGIDLGTANTLIHVSGRELFCKSFSGSNDLEGIPLAVGDKQIDNWEEHRAI